MHVRITSSALAAYMSPNGSYSLIELHFPISILNYKFYEIIRTAATIKEYFITCGKLF